MRPKGRGPHHLKACGAGGRTTMSAYLGADIGPTFGHADEDLGLIVAMLAGLQTSTKPGSWSH